MPSSSSRRAIFSLSSTESDRPSRCVPSRSVVSYRNMFLTPRVVPSGISKAARPLDFSRGRAAHHRVLQSVSRVPARRSEEHTSELQSRLHLVCRLLLEKKKKNKPTTTVSKPEYASTTH